MIRWLPLLLVAGCAAQTKPDYSDLLQPCPIAQPTRYTAHEVTRVANERRNALVKCNADKAKLREALK
jgi:hypothetical protein